MNLTFGSDPEFFAVNKNDICIPPIYFRKFLGLKPIKDDKKHPIYVNTLDGVKIHQDGAAFEFTIPPFKTAKECKHFINQGLDSLNDLISKFGFNIYTKPVVNFDPNEYYLKQDEDFKDCVRFGCDKDWDAWEYNPEGSEEINVENHKYRYGGGHWHTSGDDYLWKYILPAVKLFSLYLGNYGIANTLYPELEKIRATRYGMPGKFRPQKYPNGIKGVEYRTLSNSWCTLSEDLINGMIKQTYKMVETLHNPTKAEELLNNFGKKTIQAIVNSDQQLASEILGELN
jgi:hypothetical protein